MTAPVLNRRTLLIAGGAILAGGGAARAHNGKIHVTIDRLVFEPAEITLVTSKKPRGERWAPPIAVLARRGAPAPTKEAVAS